MMVEISHSRSRNFSSPSEFKYAGTSKKKFEAPGLWREANEPLEVAERREGRTMKYLRYVALLALLTLPVAYSQAAVVVGVGVGGYVAGPPACPYGYYSDYPYACAPYGYYGPSYFAGGVFIGAGPWFHGWGHRYEEIGRAHV